MRGEGPIAEGVHDSGGVARAAESVTKLLGALTGAAAVAYGLGAFAIARRLQVADLSWGDTIAALPKDQVLAAGTVELAYTLLGAVFLGATAMFLFVVSGGRRSWLAGGLAIFCLGSFAVVPLNPVGIASVVALAGLATWGYFVAEPWTTHAERERLWSDLKGGRPSSWSQRPVGLTMLILTTVTIIATLGRAWSFPDNFEVAHATSADRRTNATGLFIGAGSQSVVLGVRGEPRRIVLLRSESVDRLDLQPNPVKARFARSLVSRAGILPYTIFFPTFRHDP
jgi:hypothetical protein